MSRALQIYYSGFDGVFHDLPRNVQRRIEAKIDEMGVRLDSFPHHRMKGGDRYRLRVGDTGSSTPPMSPKMKSICSRSVIGAKFIADSCRAKTHPNFCVTWPSHRGKSVASQSLYPYSHGPDTMGMSFTEKIALALKGLPVQRIEKAVATTQAAGITITAMDVCTHLMCKGSVEKVIDALILAKSEGIPASWNELCAIDLATKGTATDVIKVVQESTQAHELTLSTFTKETKEQLGGICRNGKPVKATCKITYKLPLSHVFSTRLDFLQERLAARIATVIFESADMTRLLMSRNEHETSLLVLAKTVMPTVSCVELKYETAG